MDTMQVTLLDRQLLGATPLAISKKEIHQLMQVSNAFMIHHIVQVKPGLVEFSFSC